ncbi:MAG TPA: TMEM175 family protein [Gemmatimonadales bacterium]|nr:TMEM175 family protein [Gemmatimonadales bacterium]
MRPSRAEAFSDGVFAIAATLLVLELRVPAAHGDLLSALVHAWPSYASYGVSFLTIGIIWINHHAIFDQLHRVDRPLLVLNLLLLLLVGLIPFPTALMATYLTAGHDEAVAGATYGLTMTTMGVVFGTLWAYVLRTDRLRTTPLDRARKRRLFLRFAAGSPAYAVGMGVAFWNARLSLLLYAALAVYYLLAPIPIDGGTQDA